MKTTRRTVATLVLLSAVATGCSFGATPGDAYVAYRRAFDQAKSLDDLKPFMDEATIARVDAAPASERKGFFLMMKAMTEIVDLTVVKETVTGETAVLEATGVNVGTGNDSRATVKMVKQAGAWKVQNESWKGDDSAGKGPERTCPELLADLKGAAIAPRARAVSALLQRSCAGAVPELVARLTDPSLALRGNATGALRNNVREGDPKEHAAHVPEIAAAKQAAAAIEDTMAELNLQGTLSALGAPAIAHLVRDLKHSSRDLRFGAAAGLGMMGPAAKEALPAMEAAAKEEQDQTVADRLAEAIKEVKGS
jgi:hypothetical protein